jgi:hypothetical protein
MAMGHITNVHSHRDIIRILGGPSAVARFIGKNPINGVKWNRDGGAGIPPLHWVKLSTMPAAIENGITAAVLERTSPRTAQSSS